MQRASCLEKIIQFPGSNLDCNLLITFISQSPTIDLASISALMLTGRGGGGVGKNTGVKSRNFVIYVLGCSVYNDTTSPQRHYLEPSTFPN
jgi:hypothetical protein